MIKRFYVSDTLKPGLSLILFVLLFSVCWKLVVYGFVPEYDFAEYPVIPLFFAVFYILAFVSLFNKSLDSGNFVRRYLFFKIAKLFVLFAVMALWAFVLCGESVMPALVFLVFYVFMIIPETICFMYIKNRISKTV